MFKYLVCPNELSCGEEGNKFLVPKADGSVLTRKIDRNRHFLYKDDVCSYIIQNPDEMGPKDWMWVQVEEISRANVMITKGRNFMFKERWKLDYVDELRFGMIRGLSYYLIGVGTDVFPGYFKVSVWIEKHQRPE